MPELRADPLTASLVIVAPERGARPDTFRSDTVHVDAQRAPRPPVRCPFCPGNESLTPPEVARVGDGQPDAPGWQVRVVPNLYPIVSSRPPGVTGAHEVVVLSPDHERSFGLLADAAAVDALRALRDRARHHAGRHAHVQPFVNHGRAAGASIEHPHAQLVALDFVPPAVQDAMARFAGSDRDLVADSLAAARSDGLVVIDGDATAWCPFAATGPFEALVAHSGAGPGFHEAPDHVVDDVARALRELLARLQGVVGDVAYNVIVHTSPPGDDWHGRWYARVTPRLGVVAGFEHATGVLVNVLAPEVAAAALREARPA